MKNTITAVIVDDELQSINVLYKLLLQASPEVEIIGKATDCDEAAALINSLHPDLIFLDIMLRKETGFDLLQRFEKIDFEVIFTTAYNEYAIKAFKFNALDYLLKPIDKSELQNAISKAIQKIKNHHNVSKEQLGNFFKSMDTHPKIQDKIAIPTSDGFFIVQLEEIVYCQSSGSYTHFHLTNGHKLTSSYTLKQYDELLSDQNFFRAHKSFLINLSHVHMYKKGEGGSAVMSNGYEIEISRRNKDDFIKIFKA